MPPRTKDNDDVQTFLPWPGFEESAASLDRQRLEDTNAG